MLQGTIIENVPIISITIASGRGVRKPPVVLDTGFTGDLQVTPEIAGELGLETRGVTKLGLADGKTVEVAVSKAITEIEKELQSVDVIISEGNPLVGIGFLTKYKFKAIVDCKQRIITLEKAA